MLTRSEFERLRSLVQDHVQHDGERIELMRALHRETAPKEKNCQNCGAKVKNG